MSPVSPTQPDDEPPAALPRRSPSRVRFNFKDTFTPLTPATVASDEDGDRSGSSSSTAAKAPGGGIGGAAGLISDPGTPTLNLTEAAAHIRRTLSLGSLTNLLDLATEAVALQAGGSKRAALGSSALGSSSSINDVPGSPALTATPGAISGTSTATSGLSPSSSIIYLPSGTHLRSASAPAGPLSDAEHQAMHEAAMRSATLEAKREQARQTLRDVREAILRPSGEPPRRPADWERVFVLTMLKSTRSFISAFGLRAGVNVLLFVLRSLMSGRPTARGLVKAIISSTALRFALLLSTFTFLHTLVSQTLRLAPPFNYIRRRLLHSLSLLRRSYSQSTSLLEAVEEGLDVLSLDCSFGPPPIEFDTNLGERRWHAAASGAIAGGIAIYWVERKGGERRSVIEQVLVRGLEGAWRGSMRAVGWSIPHGEVVLFGLCAGQIMYSWILAPERMPSSFNRFITSTFNGPVQAPSILRSILRSRTLDPLAVRKVLDHPRGVTLRNRIAIGELLQTLEANGGRWTGPPVIPKALLQPSHDRVLPNLLSRFGLVFKGALPVYAALHTLPAVFLKRGSLVRRKTNAEDAPRSDSGEVAAKVIVVADEAKPSVTPPTGTNGLGFELGPSRTAKVKTLSRPPTATKTWQSWWRKIHWAEVIKILRRAVVGTARSGTFLALFVLIYHAAISAQIALYPHSRGLFRRLLGSKNYTWFAGALTSLALFAEAPTRRPELALYVLPKSITAAYLGLRLHLKAQRSTAAAASSWSWLPRAVVPLEEGLLTAWAMAMLCDRMRWGDEKDLSRLARKVLYQFT